MSTRPSRSTLATLTALTLVVAGCDRITAPGAPAAPAPSEHPSPLLGELLGSTWKLLSCSEQAGATARGTIGPSGGVLSAGAYRIDFPAGAVASDQEFVLTVVPGSRRQIEAHATGFDRFAFAQPVTVTMDLAGCGLLPPGLHVWYVDGQTGTLREDMGGVLDLLGRRMRFRTPHFSGYTIAWRSGEGGEEADSTSQPSD